MSNGQISFRADKFFWALGSLLSELAEHRPVLLAVHQSEFAGMSWVQVVRLGQPRHGRSAVSFLFSVSRHKVCEVRLCPFQ